MKTLPVFVLLVALLVSSCSKNSGGSATSNSLILNSITVDGVPGGTINVFSDVSVKPLIKLTFSEAVDRTSAVNAITLKQSGSTSPVSANFTYDNNDAVVMLTPVSNLNQFSSYTLTIATSLKAKSGNSFNQPVYATINTGLDSTYKYPVISDNDLLDKVQRVTFKYFWDFGHPTSGLARERNTSGDIVTTGGSGFGIMALIAAVDRNFISRADGLARMQKIVDFLSTKANRFHGAFPHWLNGNTGAVVPFSTKDDGADLVETSFLMQGLLSARQYFNDAGTAETQLRSNINTLWEAVEWDWFRKNNEDVLYWHWSPTYGWDMNMQIKGWNECLITYVLAASSPTHAVPKSVYDNGFASNGGMKNGNTYYGVQLPLGPEAGGPLFFAHYSFLGINPTNLTDAYANYGQQNISHSMINYNYAVADPKGNGYSADMWGLTASDIPNGYTASSPTNDVGVIAPTAAISSLPYTPTQSMQALKFFYYVLGDKLWKESAYGFVDAFNLKSNWYADSYLAIDQGPIIVMIENYRSGLLWKQFMSCPEVKTGMKALGFSSPNL